MKTTKKQIVEWCQKNINEIGYGVDASEMNTHCFRCGCKRPTQRCHVIPDSLGGADSPENFRLLCEPCHLEAPNVDDPEAMDQWIRQTNVGEYELFWKLRDVYVSTYEKAIIHWGEGALNSSTKKWLANEITKRYSEEFPEASQQQILGCIEDLRI